MLKNRSHICGVHQNSETERAILIQADFLRCGAHVRCLSCFQCWALFFPSWYEKNLFQAILQVVSKLNSLWDNASLSSPASKVAATGEAQLGRGSRSLFPPGIFHHTRLYGPQPCSHHACLLGLAGLFTEGWWRTLRRVERWALFTESIACYFSSVPGAATFLWESQMASPAVYGFPCNFLHSHSSIVADVETCARGPGWS